MEEEIEIQRTFEYDPEISVIRQREMIRGQAAFLEDLPKVIIEFRKIADVKYLTIERMLRKN